MKTNIITTITLFILVTITILILTTSTEVIQAVIFSFDIWKNSIFPSLFPFFIISNILVNYGFVTFLSELLSPIMYKLFKVSGTSSYVIVMSMLSGFPSSAKYIKELYDQKLIDSKEGTKLLLFTHFSNPLFILGTIASFLNNKKMGWVILFSHYLSNLIIGLFIRNLYPITNFNKKLSLKKIINNTTEYRIKNKKSFVNILNESIISAANTLLLILGTITSFLILTTIINKKLNFNQVIQTIINGLIEMTQGLKYTNILDITLNEKAILSTAFISFGGLSVHAQTMSVLSGTNIKYFPYLLARILHVIISITILLLLT